MHPSLRGDTNYDLTLDFDDIGRFVALVNGAPQDSGLVPPAQVGTPAIQFGAIDASPASGDQDEEYIELKNPNQVAVDISGWQLAGGVEYTFAPGVVLPPGGVLYVSPNVNAFRARATGPSGGQGLFVEGNYTGRISAAGRDDRTGGA